jgi:hypothetical protein
MSSKSFFDLSNLMSHEAPDEVIEKKYFWRNNNILK